MFKLKSGAASRKCTAAVLVLIMQVVFPKSSLGEVSSICGEPQGYVSDGSIIKLLDNDCEDSDELCGFVLTAPLTAHGREFQSFVLRRLDSNQKTVLQLNLNYVADAEIVETSFYAAKQMVDGFEVHAIYGRKGDCALHSVWSAD